MVSLSPNVVLAGSLLLGFLLVAVSAANSYKILSDAKKNPSAVGTTVPDPTASTTSKYWGQPSLSAGLDTAGVVLILVAGVAAYWNKKRTN
jgi:hypothetical protein